MKKIFLTFGFFLSITSISYAQSASECELSEKKDESWIEVEETLNLEKYSSSEINLLATVTKQQVIITAKKIAKDNAEEIVIKGTLDAVNFLNQSEGPYISNYTVNGKNYTEILAYLGDNPVGLIFERGTTRIIAYNNDETISCQTKN